MSKKCSKPPPRTRSQERPKARLPHESLGPNEDTLVPCPACGCGMVHPRKASEIAEQLTRGIARGAKDHGT